MDTPRDFPDLGLLCCDGYANRGPGHCTCWEPVYDLEQQPIQQGAPNQRASMCGDCAFRADSPERTGDPRFECSGDGDLDDLVYDLRCGFYCHQGMRRIVAHVHPSGARVEAPPGGYAPPINGPLSWQADGSPAEHCAGLAARRRAAGLLEG